MIRSLKSGFTLIEVCVALALLSSGTLVFGRFIDAYNRVCALERDQARALVRTSAAVEALVRTPPSCADASFEVNGAQVEVRRVPGVKPLAWVWGSASAVHDVQLRRLVRCKRR
jgi:prepilin-type N-terminal cleavage/methylation domain-containing protein